MSTDDTAIRELIDRRYAELNHGWGWSALYCPLSVRRGARVATLGLNPGGGRDTSENWHDKRQLSDEAGNSYFVQRWAGEGYSPLQVQFVRLTELLGVASDELLSANLVPFRSPSWAELPRKAESLAFGISLLGSGSV